MAQVNIHKAKTHFSRLVERAVAGEEIIIARAGRPMVKLVAVEQKPKQRREPGFMEGKIFIADDAFAPMTEEELDLWYK